MSNETGAIEYCINYARRYGCTITSKAAAELAQLRAAAAEAQAAHVYLDESYVNDPNDLPLELVERCAKLVNTIAEQARQLDEARKLEQHIRSLNDYEIEFTACPVCDYPPIICECGYVPIRAWLSAHPAPSAEPQP